MLLLDSCKKNSSELPVQKVPVNVTNLDPVVNPLTAHILSDYSFTDTALINKGWTKTFEDNFDSDLSNWNVWVGGGLQKELQCYQASNLQIVNGVLQISAKSETVTGPISRGNDTTKTFNFTSGAIESKNTISVNASTPRVRIVARIKISRGYGLATALWSFGDNWPQQGEIDYLESSGDEPTTYFTDYFYGAQVNQNVVSGAYEVNHTDGDLSAGFHIYEMEWSQNALTSYLDGKLVETKTAGGHVPDLYGKTERIYLNLSVGGLLYATLNSNDVVPGTLYVDYIKVFTSK